MSKNFFHFCLFLFKLFWILHRVTVLFNTALHERTLTVNNALLQLSITESMNSNNITIQIHTTQGLFLQAYMYIPEFKTQNEKYIYIYVCVCLKLRVVTNCTSYNTIYVGFKI